MCRSRRPPCEEEIMSSTRQALRLATAAILAASPAMVTTATDHLTVTATVLSGCSLTGGSLSFGQYVSGQACNYPHLWPAQGRLDLRLRAMLEPGKITRSGGTSKGSAQKDTLLREASKTLIRQGKMWVIASV